jgi:3-dehydroquinate synthetase
VAVVHVPTTLVSQVDSAYGGKTGVDLPEGKNYAGAYHQPAAVLADPVTLATLPSEELAAGWAEVIKTGLIAGGELWRRVRGRETPAPDRDLILACARVKLRIVARDERDAGERQVLNLGHTVGHAIETATAYERYRHGEAVGLGLLAALTLSGRPDLRDEVADLLAARGLPTRLDPAIDRAAVAAAVQRDKKRRGGKVGFVLLDAPGETRTGCPVSEDELAAAIEELAAP